MADCSELAKNLAQIAMNLATNPDVKNLDDVTHEMKKLFPEINREVIVDAIIESTKKEATRTDDLSRKLLEIRREARSDKALQKKIDELEDFLETGKLPERKEKKATPLRITELRKTRDNLLKWLETGDPAMKKKFTKQLKEVTDQLAKGEVTVVARKGKLHEEIQQIKNEIDAIKEQISADRKDVLLRDKIEILQAHLDSGTLPEVTARKTTGRESTVALRSIIHDLRSDLGRSEPARKKRIQKSIADLEARLNSGDILPKPLPPRATSKELDKLIFKRDLIRKEIQDEIRSMQPKTLWGRVGAGVDLARLTMTTGEFSYGLRQGGVYALTHPVKWTGAMAQSFKAFTSAESLHAVNKEIFDRPNAPLYHKSGLVLLHEGMSLTKSEEVIMNYWMDKLPVFRNFNRGAIAFFNTVRADMFDLGYETIGANGSMTDAEQEIWSNYINVMSGRGKLSAGPVNLEPAALALNRAMFSARYVASRFQMIAGQPLWHQAKGGKASVAVRSAVAKEYARLGMGLTAILSLGLLMGADIEWDPTSSDFGKLKFGNRRLDVLMGHGQIITYMARLLTGKLKSGSGRVISLRGDEKKYGGADIADVMFRFGRSKLSPHFGFAINLLTGENMIGEEVTLLNSIPNMLYPMTWGDIYRVMQEDGVPANVALSTLAMLGMGLQTYETGKQTKTKARTGF